MRHTDSRQAWRRSATSARYWQREVPVDDLRPTPVPRPRGGTPFQRLVGRVLALLILVLLAMAILFAILVVGSGILHILRDLLAS